MGIKTYLVIDAITPRSKERPQIELHLWRNISGVVQTVAADAEGYLTLPEMQLKVRAIGRRLVFVDAVTDKVLLDNKDFAVELAANQEARVAAEIKAAEAYQMVALEMWRKGLDLALIAEVTGLSETELEDLVAQRG